MSESGISLPSLSGISGWVAIVLGGIVVAALLGFITYWFAMRLKYNKTLVLFRMVGSKIMPIGTDKAMFARLGIAGDYWTKTRKFKKTLPRLKIQMGKNLYWVYEREDGEWINFGLEDIDARMKAAKAYYVDEDMRLQRLGIQKNLEQRLQKVTFWQQYGGMIMSAFFILVITVSLVVLFREMKGNWSAAVSAAESIEHMAVAVENVATRLGGGVAPAP